MVKFMIKIYNNKDMNLLYAPCQHLGIIANIYSTIMDNKGVQINYNITH